MPENVEVVVGHAGQAENQAPVSAPQDTQLHKEQTASVTVPQAPPELAGPTVEAGSAGLKATATPPAPEASPALASQDGVFGGEEVPYEEQQEDDVQPRVPRLVGGGGHTRGRRLVKPAEEPARSSVSPEQKLLILDTWNRSGLGGGEFADMLGISKQTLHIWKRRFEEQGPAGLLDRSRGRGKGSRLPEITKRAILMLKQANPAWGCERISDMLVRGPALPASASAVARVLHEAGYETVEEPTRPHPDRVRSFERAKPNQLWQTDLFVFNLKRQNRRLYLIAFLDDHSRFVVSYGLYGSSSTALVLEVLNAAIASYGAPEEILTDNGPQYVVWRGKSAFTKELEKRGIRQLVAHPRRPQTLGKVERFWGTLWRECLEASIFMDVQDARKRIGLFIDYYNFQRPHQSLEGLVPADRFFQAAPEVLRTLKARVAANALELARHGVPLRPFYLTGQLGGKSFSVHAEGERMILTRTDGQREELDLHSPRAQQVLAEMPQQPAPVDLPEPLAAHGPSRDNESPAAKEQPPAPGVSALDAGLAKLAAASPEGGAA